jgi:hypothetical protein
MKGEAGSTRSGTRLPSHRTEDRIIQKSLEDNSLNNRRRSNDRNSRMTRSQPVPQESDEEDEWEETQQTGNEEPHDFGEATDIPQLPFVGVPPVKRVAFEGPPTPREKSIPDVERKEKAFRNVAPVEKRSEREDVIERLMEAPITFRLQDLLSEKGLREALRKELTPKRVSPPSKGKQEMLDGIKETKSHLDDGSKTKRRLDTLESFLLRDDVITVDTLPKAGYTVSPFALQGIPAGSYIMEDPVEQYLHSLPEGEMPKRVFVARESHALRTLFPLVNGQSKCETIMDSGSQLVSMKERIARELGICWSPDVKVDMQSANGSVESTLGLARNVPFCFNGQITLYFQVHIMKDPAYMILMGRPFDAIGQSWIKNESDGSQTITITDPNSGKHLTMPTYERGQRSILTREKKPDEVIAEEDGEAKEVFRNSSRN